MLQNKIFSSILLVALAFMSNAQFGNEWIDYTQSYFKIKIVEDGFYRVTASELQAQGFPVASVPANRIQLFRRGQEVAIQVNSSRGVLNYLEFYGLKNSGEGDVNLYIEPEAQPHDSYNLFTDTATYFLTWKLIPETGSRMGFSSLSDFTGLTPEIFHLEEDLTVDFSSYASGIKFGSGFSASLSQYDFGEGWTGPFISKGRFKQFDLVLNNYENTGIDPKLELVIVGGNTLNHNVDVEVGRDIANLRNIGNVQFSNRSFKRATFSFLDSDIGASGEMVVRVNTTGFTGASDHVSTALIRVTYPQTVSMTSAENKLFTTRELLPTDRAYLQIETSNAAGTEIYDISNALNPVRITSTNFSDRLECIIPGPETERKILAVTNPIFVAKVEPVSFEAVDVTSDYLIVTHAALRQVASDGLDPIQSFADYRASIVGGGYSSVILNFFDVVDQFNFGDISPLAIRNLLDFAITNGTPEALFLIGKGRTPDANFYRLNNHAEVNVPTFGDPGGDLLFSSGLGAEPFVPVLPVGRLNAFDSEGVKSYVDKVIEMEAVPFDNLNRKNVLQLSGGQSSHELASFKNNIEDFEKVLEADFLGGLAINVGKETTENVEVVDVVDEINDGVSLVTFFGHSSGTVTEIEIGRVSDGQFGYNNQAKYPVFLVNGCNAGDIYGTNFTFGEDWMITPKVGALAFIAHADFAGSGALKRYSDIFYDLSFAQEAWFSKSLGSIIIESSRLYFERYGTSNASQTQALQVVLQGDPMVKIFGINQPDYEIVNERIWVDSFENGQLIAAQDSFKVNMVVRNYGRTVSDPLIVQIRRTLPNGSILTSFKEFLRPLREDTLAFTLFNLAGQDVDGTNTFEITLDPNNDTAELNEGNNLAVLVVKIFSGNTSHLYPSDFSIYPEYLVSFIWQPVNVFEASRSYELQIDSVDTFNSPYFRTLTEVGKHVLTSDVDFSLDNLSDTTTIYWRTRFTNPVTAQEKEWKQTSFTIVNEGDVGWGQFEKGQLVQGDLSGVEYGNTSDNWQFITSDLPLDIQTFGSTHPNFDYDDLMVIAGGIDYLITSNTIDPQCASNTLNALIFDKESTNPYRPIEINGADVFSRLVCGRLPQMIYNMNETDLLGAEAYLETLIANMSVGDHILLFNIGQVNFSNWDTDVLNSLQLVGVNSGDITSLTDGQPIIVLGRKGDAPGLAKLLNNNGSANPVTEQSIQFLDNVNGSFTSGNLTSGKIGPAKSWTQFAYQINKNPEDDFDTKLTGVTSEGNEVDLFFLSQTENQDLSSVDATQYPYMKVNFSFTDDTELTSPQLRYWQLTYEQPPEGILLTNDTETDVIFEGQSVKKDFLFLNLSTTDFKDSLEVSATLLSKSNGNRNVQSYKIEGPLAGDTTIFSTNISSVNQDGLNNLMLQLVANENELYSFNNRLTIENAANVQADNTNPILDVTFDGAYILNGDIVSPDPTILIRMRDDNSYLVKSDTIGLEIQLMRPCEGCGFERISFSDQSMNYSVTETDFEITYEPGSLDDGLYTLSVQGRDESGNAAGNEPYKVDFEVISKSSITHFYPYPNPFSTQTRFVFTLTGSIIPDKLKIQIMTISGRVVREINQNEIGPIKIGNNITEFAWNGTDRHGDNLANGVYFYRVLMDSGNEKFEKRSTSADVAFKNGFGKLYILR